MASKRTWILWAGCAAVGAMAASCHADKARRRMYTNCGNDDDCESSVCYEGACSASCATSSQCGGGVCVEKHCMAVGAVCNDHNACTSEDKVTATGCAGAKPVDCGPDNACQAMVCSPSSGCGAVAKNVGQPCDGALSVCAAGGLETGGCKCSVWQGKCIGPYDQTAIKEGKPISLDVGVVQVRGLYGEGKSLLQAGKAIAKAGDPSRSWVASSNLTAQIEWSAALPPADVTAVADELLALGGANGKHLAAGVSGNELLLVSFTDAAAAAKNPALWLQHKVAVPGGDVPAPQSAAVDTSGSFAVVGKAGNSALLVRGKLAGDADFAEPQVQLFKSANAGAGDSARLGGAATHPNGWLGAGSTLVGGNQQMWLAYTESGFGGTIATTAVTVPGTTGGALEGVLRANDLWVVYGTARTTSNKIQCVVAGLNADFTVKWSLLLAPDGKPDFDAATAIAAASVDNANFLVLATVGTSNSAFAFMTDGKAAKTQAVTSNGRLRALATYAGGFAIGTNDTERAIVQRLGPTGQSACP